jgi:hypothetical protein
MRTETRPPERLDLAPAEPKGDRFLMVGLAVAAVWVGVGAASLFAPDMVTGAFQDHLPMAAITMWLWGAVATGLILMAGAMGRGVADGRWRALALMIAAIWAIVAAASIWAPQLVTGTDPTRIPLAALLAPVAGVIATAFVCLFVAGTARER